MRPLCYCSKYDQWISHGIIYKQRSITEADKVGKRIFCSNRYGHTGCGRTFQLYVATIIPRFHYSTAVLCAFIRALIDHLSVVKAYQKATHKPGSRQAWRWLQGMMRQLGEYRCFVKQPTTDNPSPFHHRSRRLQLLLPSLQQIKLKLAPSPCLLFQYKQQQAFIR